MIEFFVQGIPVQKGNHKAFCPRCSQRNGIVILTGRRGFPYIVDDWSSDLGKRLKRWQNAIVSESLRHKPPLPWSGAVAVEYWFFFDRPKSNADPFPTSSRIPDYDKLARTVNDALQVKGKAGGRIMGDDGFIMDATERLRWSNIEREGEPSSNVPGALIRCWALEAEQLPLTDDAPLIQPRIKRKPKAPKKFGRFRW